MEEAAQISLLGPSGPGSSALDPVALVVHSDRSVVVKQKNLLKVPKVRSNPNYGKLTILLPINNLRIYILWAVYYRLYSTKGKFLPRWHSRKVTAPRGVLKHLSLHLPIQSLQVKPAY